jgi:hypothetical protein
VRWPGETILSTVRSQGSVAGVPAGFPGAPCCAGGIQCYNATVYGGAGIYACSGGCCQQCPEGSLALNCINCCAWMAAGCGGGGGGGRPGYYIFGGGYVPCCCGIGGVGGCPGNGFLVVEY